MTTSSDTSTEIRRWLREIEQARRREKDFRKEGKRVLDIYNGTKRDATPFNILYSNTETLAPALYGASPRPVIERRFKDADPLGKAASEASKRVTSFLLDTNSEDYEDFDTSMKDVVLDACLPGRGVMEFCYDPTFAPPAGPDEPEQLVSECVYSLSSPWTRYLQGYAKKWCDVPWIAFELYFDKSEATKEFGSEITALIKFVPENSEDEDRENGKKDSEDGKSERKVACVYKVWDKKGMQLLYLSPNLPDRFLKEEPDPLGITGFFPVPRPLRLHPKSNDQMPVALYLLYENQAKELNRITVRINKLLEMCKVRGVYDSSLTEIEDVMKKEDGSLIPASQAATLNRSEGLDKHIWLVPIDKIITVIQQLFIAREAAKRVIYEITGLSDIMRGDTQASETLGAQKLKSQWGTMRLKKMQREVQRYARDCIRIMLEIAVNKFQPETWARMTGLPFLQPQEVAQLQQIAQASQATGQPLDPQVQEKLAQPQWTQVIQLLKDKLSREYRIDVETNSTVDPNASEDKQNIAELMNAMSQFLNGVGPLVQQGALPIEVAKAMMLAVCRRFEFGSEVEDYIREMKQPAPQAGPPDKSGEQKLQLQLQEKTAEQSLIERHAKLDVRDLELTMREQLFQKDQALAAKDHEIAQHKLKNIVTDGQRAAVDQVKQLHAKHETQVRSTVDKFTRQADVAAKKSDAVKGDGQVAALTALVDKLVEMQKNLMDALGSQGKEVNMKFEELIKALLAPKDIVRDKEGRATGLAPKAA